MDWNIIADSSSNMFGLEDSYDNIFFSTVPFVISVDEKDYVDDEDLDTGQLVEAMLQCREASHTACPSPGVWCEAFERPGNVIAVTISSNLSGSYNSACSARDMAIEENPDRNIAVIDSKSAGPEMMLIIRQICRMIGEGKDFDEVLSGAREHMRRSHIIFALSSYDNLIKNGRMSKLKGFLANKLGFWGVGIGSETGTIEIKGIVRGKKKMVDFIIQDMVERGIPEKEVIISHCQNAEAAEKLKAAVQEKWQGIDVTVMPDRGLCSYYAEKGGLIVGY